GQGVDRIGRSGPLNRLPYRTATRNREQRVNLLRQRAPPMRAANLECPRVPLGHSRLNSWTFQVDEIGVGSSGAFGSRFPWRISMPLAPSLAYQGGRTAAVSRGGLKPPGRRPG